jgi:hypothetical protein
MRGRHVSMLCSRRRYCDSRDFTRRINRSSSHKTLRAVEAMESARNEGMSLNNYVNVHDLLIREIYDALWETPAQDTTGTRVKTNKPGKFVAVCVAPEQAHHSAHTPPAARPSSHLQRHLEAHMVEHLPRTLKEQRAHRPRVENLARQPYHRRPDPLLQHLATSSGVGEDELAEALASPSNSNSPNAIRRWRWRQIKTSVRHTEHAKRIKGVWPAVRSHAPSQATKNGHHG